MIKEQLLNVVFLLKRNFMVYFFFVISHCYRFGEPIYKNISKY